MGLVQGGEGVGLVSFPSTESQGETRTHTYHTNTRSHSVPRLHASGRVCVHGEGGREGVKDRLTEREQRCFCPQSMDVLPPRSRRPARWRQLRSSVVSGRLGLGQPGRVAVRWVARPGPRGRWCALRHAEPLTPPSLSVPTLPPRRRHRNGPSGARLTVCRPHPTSGRGERMRKSALQKPSPQSPVPVLTLFSKRRSNKAVRIRNHNSIYEIKLYFEAQVL